MYSFHLLYLKILEIRIFPWWNTARHKTIRTLPRPKSMRSNCSSLVIYIVLKWSSALCRCWWRGNHGTRKVRWRRIQYQNHWSSRYKGRASVIKCSLKNYHWIKPNSLLKVVQLHPLIKLKYVTYAVNINLFKELKAEYPRGFS